MIMMYVAEVLTVGERLGKKHSAEKGYARSGAIEYRENRGNI